MYFLWADQKLLSKRCKCIMFRMNGCVVLKLETTKELVNLAL